MQTTTSQTDSPVISVEERYLLDVLSAFLDGRPLEPVPKGASTNAFLRAAREQRVSQIVAYMALKNPGVLPPQLTAKLVDDLNRAVGMEVAQTAEFNAVNRAFVDAGVRFMPLKGFIMRDYYPERYLRLVGDYDALVERESFSRAGEVLTRLGFSRRTGDEHHDVYEKPPRLVVELHFKLFDAYGAYRTGRTVAWNRLVPFEGTEFRFTKEDFYRFMVEHLLKHWLSSEEAVRDYLDVAIYLRKFGRELNRAKLDADLESSGALEFVKNVERLVAFWFDGASGSPTLDEMTRYAFRRLPINRTSKTDRSEKYAAQLAAGATGPSGAGSRRARYVVENLFPRRAACEIDRRTAETPRALRPFHKLALWAKFWFKRVFRVQFFVNALAFARAGSAKTDATAEFQRRVGIAPEKFNAQDWTAED
ncbi:MAG: nucleotidyltransferase family protein [Thermoguttaceae bacterium]|nr:nucleotidyltransferase family protein [Thermoguttaceae bacterium]